jgi:drug/metabolite transporter (DMT)-like permease
VLAALGGFGAALAWAASTLCSSRASRMIDPASVVAWVSLVGLLLIAPFVLIDGVPARLDGVAAGWLAVAGAGNIVGLLLAYLAYRSGAVSLIAPLVATEGAIAALISILGGEGIGAGTAAALGVIATGVSLAAVPARSAHEHQQAPTAGRVLVLAALAAICFGFSLYATGHVSSLLPLAWVVLPARLLGSALIALPLLATGRLRLTARASWLLAVAGACEVLGFASYTLGARHDIAVAAVFSCQFAAISSVAAYLLFRERIGRVQVAGVTVLLIGVSLLSGIHG